MYCVLSPLRRGPRGPPLKVSPASPINLTDVTNLTSIGSRMLSCLLVSYRPLTLSVGLFTRKKGKTAPQPLKSAAALRGSTFRAVKTRRCLARFSRVATKNSFSSGRERPGQRSRGTDLHPVRHQPRAGLGRVDAAIFVNWLAISANWVATPRP